MASKIDNFVSSLVEEDKKKDPKLVVTTRFPPEPNGYLHLGHAKSMYLNFGIASDFNGRCNLRFDDTNPSSESEEFLKAIIRDVKWLGFRWSKLCHASDYFEELFEFALHLIRSELAYVDEQSYDEIKLARGTLVEPGVDSPFRMRGAKESEDLFLAMRDGKIAAGLAVLRARISMLSPNINLRDPILYRIKHEKHPRAGTKWCIYPTYDFAHGQSDSIEGVTHSLCTLEFEDHRPLYEWFLKHLPVKCKPKQIEFSRLNLEGTLTSKRKLSTLVENGLVNGWDDPRMPTIAGLRRRGYSAQGIKIFCDRVGVTRRPNVIEFSTLEQSIRDDLDVRARRGMAVFEPLKVSILNWNRDFLELNVPWNIRNPESEFRSLFFDKNLYIERSDFAINPPTGYRRLEPGGSVRLKHGFIIDYVNHRLNANGQVSEIFVNVDFETRSGSNGSSRKVKGTIHWVEQNTAASVEVRLYDRLFCAKDPASAKNLESIINPDSLIVKNALVEPALNSYFPDTHFQFERIGFFYQDFDSVKENIVYNRTATLKDGWKSK